MNKLIRRLRKILHDLVVIIAPSWARKKMLSCKDVLNLLSDDQHKPSLATYMKLKMHLLICQCCVDYSAQMEFIETKSSELGKVNLNQDQLKQIKLSQQKVLDKLKED